MRRLSLALSACLCASVAAYGCDDAGSSIPEDIATEVTDTGGGDTGPDAADTSDTTDADVGPTCDDGTQNGDETDVDCGGETCEPCGDGAACLTDTDCESAFCHPDTLTCAQPSCGDGIVQAGEDCDDASESATCDADCTAPACGDGVTNTAAGEVCDDGNQDDTDACTNACAAAACGDGIVGPGEGCDDSNTVDDDECTNACALASCGDAIVQAGEDCDDANTDNTDACLDTCVTASCGDGAVQAGVEACDDMGESATCNADCTAAVCGDGLVNTIAGETCDDGDQDDTDTCTILCEPPSCADGIVSGDEGGVDCGGSCGRCATGAACSVGDDCASGICANGVCAAPVASCATILAASASTSDGVYTIDPSGANAFDAHCDMSNGGFTLLLSADGNSTFWGNNSSNWYDATPSGAVPTSLVNADFKSSAYSELTTNDIRLCYADTTACYTFAHGLGVSLFDFFDQGLTHTEYSLDSRGYVDVGTDSIRTDFVTATGFNPTAVSCYWLGINDTVSISAIGLLGDVNGGCASLTGSFLHHDDLAVGLGLQSCLDANACANGGSGHLAGTTAHAIDGVGDSGEFGPWFVFGR